MKQLSRMIQKSIKATLLIIVASLGGELYANNAVDRNSSTNNILTLPKLKALTHHHNHSSLPNFQNPLNILDEKEKQAGRLFFASIQRHLSLNTDPIMQQYIHDLGNLLVNYAHVINPHYIFFVVNEPSINAFAGPAGYIGLNSGLILSASSEGMLASVVAHEIAHHKQRHLNRLSASQNNSYANPLVILGLLLAGVITNSPYVIPGVLTLQGKYIENSLDLLRKFETEADLYGLRILQEAGFSGLYATAFMTKLLEKSYDLDSNEYLRTHPVTRKRISNMQNQIKDKRFYAPKSEFDLIQARLSYLSKLPTQDSLSTRQKNYINLLKHIRNNDNQKAFGIWKKLSQETQKESLLFNILYMKILINNNQIKQAQIQSEKLQRFYPNHLGVLAVQTELYIKQEKFEQAEKNILQYINKADNNLYQGHLWKLLIDIYFNEKKKVELFYAKSKENYSLALLRKALEYLDNAIKSAQAENRSLNEINKLKDTYNNWHHQLYTSSYQEVDSPHKLN